MSSFLYELFTFYRTTSANVSLRPFIVTDDVVCEEEETVAIAGWVSQPLEEDTVVSVA